MRVCVCALARVCALPLEREEVKMTMKLFLVSTKIEAFFSKKKYKTLNLFVLLVLLNIFVNPTMSINNGSVGLVGYNVRLTKRQAIRGRSPVRFWYGILFLPKAVPGTARGAFWMDERRFSFVF